MVVSPLGNVHFWGMPICNDLSDLTARFYIRQLDDTSLTLEFIDLHVM